MKKEQLEKEAKIILRYLNRAKTKFYGDDILPNLDQRAEIRRKLIEITEEIATALGSELGKLAIKEIRWIE